MVGRELGVCDAELAAVAVGLELAGVDGTADGGGAQAQGGGHFGYGEDFLDHGRWGRVWSGAVRRQSIQYMGGPRQGLGPGGWPRAWVGCQRPRGRVKLPE